MAAATEKIQLEVGGVFSSSFRKMVSGTKDALKGMSSAVEKTDKKISKIKGFKELREGLGRLKGDLIENKIQIKKNEEQQKSFSQAVSKSEKTLNSATKKLQANEKAHKKLTSQKKKATDREKELRLALNQSIEATGLDSDATQRLRRELSQATDKKKQLNSAHKDSVQFMKGERAGLKSLRAEHEKNNRALVKAKSKADILKSAENSLKKSFSSATTKIKEQTEQLRKQGIQIENIDKAEKRLTKRRERQRRFSDLGGVSALGGGIAGASSGIVGGVRSAAQMGAYGVATGTMAMLPTASFEEAVTRAASTAGIDKSTKEGMADYQRLYDAALKVGATTQFSASEAAAMANELALAGFTIKEIEQSMKPIANLSAATGSSLKNSGDILSNIQSGFGLSAETSGSVVDILTKTTTSAAVNLEQLGASFEKVAPTAAQYGLSLEKASAMLGVLGDAGARGEYSGTALQGILQRLYAPTDEAAATMERLGVSAYDAFDEPLEPMELMQKLSRKIAKETKKDQAAITKAIFGTGSGVSTAWGLMFKDMTEGNNKIEEMTRQLVNSSGTAARISEQNSDNVVGVFRTVGSVIESEMIQTMKEALPTVKTLGKEIASVAKSFGEWAREEKVVEKICGVISDTLSFIKSDDGKSTMKWAAGIAASAWALGKVGGAIESITNAIPALRAAIAGVALLSNPYAFAAGIGIAIGAVGYLLYKHWDDIKEWGSNAIDSITSSVSSAVESMIDRISGAYKTFKRWWNDEITDEELEERRNKNYADRANERLGGYGVGMYSGANKHKSKSAEAFSNDIKSRVESGAKTNIVNDNSDKSMNIVVNAAPGQSEQLLVDEIQRRAVEMRDKIWSSGNADDYLFDTK